MFPATDHTLKQSRSCLMTSSSWFDLRVLAQGLVPDVKVILEIHLLRDPRGQLTVGFPLRFHEEQVHDLPSELLEAGGESVPQRLVIEFEHPVLEAIQQTIGFFGQSLRGHVLGSVLDAQEIQVVNAWEIIVEQRRPPLEGNLPLGATVLDTAHEIEGPPQPGGRRGAQAPFGCHTVFISMRPVTS